MCSQCQRPESIMIRSTSIASALYEWHLELAFKLVVFCASVTMKLRSFINAERLGRGEELRNRGFSAAREIASCQTPSEIQ